MLETKFCLNEFEKKVITAAYPDYHIEYKDYHRDYDSYTYVGLRGGIITPGHKLDIYSNDYLHDESFKKNFEKILQEIDCAINNPTVYSCVVDLIECEGEVIV